MRHIKLYTILQANILIFGLLSVCGAQVIEGDLGLSTQAEVNSFNGTSITGDLFISGTDIVDLATLSTLTSVGGDLTLYLNTELTNLNGLNNLDSVGNDLHLDKNYKLTNIDALSNIAFLGGDLFILQQNILTNLDGLSNLTSVGKNLTLENNYGLTNIDGLSNLTSVGNRVLILNNRKLTNLDGLINLTYIGGFLSIHRNKVLTNLDGLMNLTFIGSYLSIVDNDSLKSFCGLFALLNTNGLSGYYDVNSNLVNPTQQQIIDDGPCTTSISSENEVRPNYYKLEQNYPNPFNSTTTFSYQLKSKSNIRLSIYDVSGKYIQTIVNESQSAGEYSISFNANHLASGIYFYILEVDSYVLIRKMLLVK
jgi:hypothetical protein